MLDGSTERGQQLLNCLVFEQVSIVFAFDAEPFRRLLGFKAQIQQRRFERHRKAARFNRPSLKNLGREVLQQQSDIVEGVLI